MAISKVRSLLLLLTATGYLVMTSFSPISTTIIAACLGGVILIVYFYRSTPKEILNKTESKKFKLIKKQSISPNTAIYKFQLPSNQSLPLPIGQHVTVTATVEGKEVSRSYTPITNETHKGYFELLIKSYPQGMLSKHFSSLVIGDEIRVKGPKGNFSYTPNMYSHLTMVAGGTGLTPMFQIIENILMNPLDVTKIRFIYANVTIEDILLKARLDLIVSERFQVYYVLNTPPSNWEGGVGFVTKEIIETRGYSYEEGRKALVCGPPPMVKAVVGIFEEIGYPKAQPISKMGDAIFKF